MANNIDIKNKKAQHDFEFLEKYTAGIILKGTEIKSIRQGKASIVDTFCHFINGELWVRNMQITEYANRGYVTHDPKSDRKLLLKGIELKKLERKTREKGLTIVATRLFIASNGYAKLNIALARGKKEYDKREDIKKRDTKREHDRMLKV
jgi:SsrA-binding protein